MQPSSVNQQRNAAMSSGAAVTADGNNAVQTITVMDTASADQDLIITFTRDNTGSAGSLVDLVLKAGCWNPTRALPPGVTFQSDNFSSYSEFLQYHQPIRTMWPGVTIDTDNVSNFNGYFERTQKDATGRNESSKTRVKGLRQVLGGGDYGNQIVVPESAFNVLLWPGLELVWKGMERSSTIAFTFKPTGWNKPTELAPMNRTRF